MMTRYKDLLTQSNRVSDSQTEIVIIDPARREEFFIRIKEDKEMDLELKAFLALSYSGGLRVTEALNERPCDIDIATRYFTVAVLKKRHKDGSKKRVLRKAKLHPIAAEILSEYLIARKARFFEPIFKSSRQTLYKAVRDAFGQGASPHTIARHSYISWLLHEKKKSPATVSRLVSIDISNVVSYNHTNVLRELDELETVA